MKTLITLTSLLSISLGLSLSAHASGNSLTPYGVTLRCEISDDVNGYAYVLSNPQVTIVKGDLLLSLDSVALKCAAERDGSMNWHFASMPAHSKLVASYWASAFQTKEYAAPFEDALSMSAPRLSIPLKEVFSADELSTSGSTSIKKELHLMLESDASGGLLSSGRYLLELDFKMSDTQAQVLRFEKE